MGKVEYLPCCKEGCQTADETGTAAFRDTHTDTNEIHVSLDVAKDKSSRIRPLDSLNRKRLSVSMRIKEEMRYGFR
jgi:hypothetical protein